MVNYKQTLIELLQKDSFTENNAMISPSISNICYESKNFDKLICASVDCRQCAFDTPQNLIATTKILKNE
jgi:hypothetical protein